MWSGDDSFFDTFINGLKLVGDTPINAIINLRYYPYELPMSFSQKIRLGRNDTNIVGYPLLSSYEVLDFGSTKINPKYKCFLDFEPYTSVDITLPYAGTVQIDTQKLMGKTINLKLIVDYNTGSCTWCIFSDSSIVQTVSGTIGTNITVSATNDMQYSTSIINNALSLAGNTAATLATLAVPLPAIGAKAATTSTALAVTGALPYATSTAASTTSTLARGATMLQRDVSRLGIVGDIVNLAHTPLTISNKGSSDSMISNVLPQYPYITVYRPIPNEPKLYGRDFGYACEISDTLSNFEGYTVCYNPKIDTPATETEIVEIQSMLSNGVYI